MNRRHYDTPNATRRMQKTKGFIERLMRARRAKKIHRIRSNLRRQRQTIVNLSKDIDQLEQDIRDAERRRKNAEDESERLRTLFESERQAGREKGAENEILHKQVSHLTAIIERDRLRVQSEMRVYTDLIEGDRDIINPSRVVADRMRGME